MPHPYLFLCIDVIDHSHQLMHDIWAAHLLETTYATPPMIPKEIIDDSKEIKEELKQQMDENSTDILASSEVRFRIKSRLNADHYI